MTFHIHRKEAVDAALRRVACKQLDRAIADAGNRKLSAAEAVHRVRKQCKQIRALLRLARPQRGAALDVENARYSAAARAHGGVRDARIAVTTLDELVERFREPLDERAFAKIRAHFVRRRAQLARARDVRRSLREVRRRLRDGRARVAAWPLDVGDFAGIAGGLRKSYAQARKTMRHACAAPSSETVHEWRKRVKDHQYHVQLLRSAWKGPLHARHDEVHALADALGDDHDLSVLRDALLALCERTAYGETPQAVVALVDRRQVELRVRAEALGARVFAEKPKAFERRIAAYWSAWRRELATAAATGHRPKLVAG